LCTFENVQILRQLLSALRYLHELKPPIGHRDIKPDNILVLYRHSSGIYVKFADFGLAKAADYLKTFCGTLQWAAPEIYNKISNKEAAADIRYSVAVDIWSLGVVIASQECGLPPYKDSYQASALAWIRAVLQHVATREDNKNELLCFLLDTMLVVNPQERKKAAYCHEEALRLSNCGSRQPFIRRISPGGHGEYTCSDTDESDKKSDLSTSTPSIPDVQPSMGHGEAASINSSLIADLGYRGTDRINSIVNLTGAGTSQDSVLSTPAAQLRQERNNSVASPQENVLDSLVWNPKPASSSSNHDAAAMGACSAQINVRPEGADASFLIRHYLGGRAQENKAQEAVEVSQVRGGEPRQPERKRIWPEDRNPLVSAHQFYTNSTQGNAGCDNTVGRHSHLSGALRVGKRRRKVASGENLGSA
jgi:serine/threonine protein kinase